MGNRFRVLCVALLISTMGIAQLAADERMLSGSEIKAALSGKTVSGKHKGKAWSQSFNKNGATVYTSESEPSPGRWRVDGNKYCSQWPPASRWDCYDMSGDIEADPATVTWIYPDGARWRGAIDE